MLRQDRELALFPILSGIVSLLVLATFALPSLLLLPWAELSHLSSSSGFHAGAVLLHGELRVAHFDAYLVLELLQAHLNLDQQTMAALRKDKPIIAR